MLARLGLPQSVVVSQVSMLIRVRPPQSVVVGQVSKGLVVKSC
jgi:hypothetical protein